MTINKLTKKIDNVKKIKKTHIESIRVSMPNMQLGHDTR